ncbi:MAG: ElyC/SanA/YdcF family protein [Campylobacterota bacterium]|nr:ElyC/SanA/YdcF family protein [Campylobacterota bacterium]
MLFLFSYPPFSNFLIQNLEDRYIKYDDKEDIKYIHVLGHGHNTDITQPLSSNISSAGVKRVIEGVILHKQIDGSKLIFTGYEGSTNISNAQMNANLALALGVEAQNMIINPKPKDTAQEAEFTKSILDKKPFILVTSASHMARSMKLFESLGLNPIAAPTNFYKKEFRGFLIAPNVGSFNISRVAMHEYLGILWNEIKWYNAK